MKIESRILNEAEYKDWDQFVASCTSGSVYATSQYLEVLAECVGARIRVMALVANGKYVGGIVLLEKATRWGQVLEPRVLHQYNGFLLGDSKSKYPSKQTSSVINKTDQIAAFLEKQGYANTLVKCRWPFEDVRAFLVRGWRAMPTYTYIVPLSNLAQQWNLVDKNLKRLVRRCENEGLTVSEDDDFDSFYLMHQETHERKGAPIYLDRPIFSNYFHELHKAGIARLYQARLPEGTSIAAQLVLAGGHSICETVSACADGNYLNMGASAFLRWRAFERLAAEGYKFNDLTDASLNNVTRFKSQFGGELRLCMALIYPATRRYRLGTRLESLARALLRR